MIGVSNVTLLKPGALSPAEVDEIREHPWLGERIVAPVPALGGVARQVIACHHERWDGSGYPRGLRGVEIPIAARIFAVVDAYDAMTNDQPYRDALSVEERRATRSRRRPGSSSTRTSSPRSSRSSQRRSRAFSRGGGPRGIQRVRRLEAARQPVAVVEDEKIEALRATIGKPGLPASRTTTNT